MSLTYDTRLPVQRRFAPHGRLLTGVDQLVPVVGSFDAENARDLDTAGRAALAIQSMDGGALERHLPPPEWLPQRDGALGGIPGAGCLNFRRSAALWRRGCRRLMRRPFFLSNPSRLLRLSKGMDDFAEFLNANVIQIVRHICRHCDGLAITSVEDFAGCLYPRTGCRALIHKKLGEEIDGCIRVLSSQSRNALGPAARIAGLPRPELCLLTRHFCRFRPVFVLFSGRFR